MTSCTSEDMFEYAQKKYQLSKEELSKLSLLLSDYPDAFPDWEEMVGLTPPQIAHQVAKEFCVKFPEPIRILFSDGKERLHTFTPESFIAAIGPHKSWAQLEGALRNISRFFEYGERYNFFERKIFIIYATLRRKDFYGLRGESKDPEVLERKRAAKKREFEIEINGKKQKLEFPKFNTAQCRHCWRYVLVDPRQVTRKAPLCAQHDYPSSNKAYRARERLIPVYEKVRRELQKEITPQYKKQKTDGADVEFLRNLATLPDSPFSELSSHLRSLGLPLKTDEDLLRAFNFIGDRKLPPEYGKQFEAMIGFFLEFNSGVPVPFTIIDCINAEAWLRAGKKCIHL